MTSAELTTFLNENAAEAAEQKTLANIARRASTLWADGYRYNRSGDELFFVYGPKGGQPYTLDFDTVFGTPFCTCPCFVKRKTCKHFLAVSALLWQEEQAQEAALLAEAEEAEACREFYADTAEHYADAA